MQTTRSSTYFEKVSGVCREKIKRKRLMALDQIPTRSDVVHTSATITRRHRGDKQECGWKSGAEKQNTTDNRFISWVLHIHVVHESNHQRLQSSPDVKEASNTSSRTIIAETHYDNSIRHGTVLITMSYIYFSEDKWVKHKLIQLPSVTKHFFFFLLVKDAVVIESEHSFLQRSDIQRELLSVETVQIPWNVSPTRNEGQTDVPVLDKNKSH